MLSGATWSAAAIVGTAVLRIVVSSDSIKNATAISHGTRRLLEAVSEGCEEGASTGLDGLIGLGCIGLPDLISLRVISRKTDYRPSNSRFADAAVIQSYVIGDFDQIVIRIGAIEEE